MSRALLRCSCVLRSPGAPPISPPPHTVDPALSPALDDLLQKNVPVSSVRTLRSVYRHLSHEKAVYVLRTRAAADQLCTSEANSVHLSELLRAEMYVDAVHFAALALPRLNLRIVHKLFADLCSAARIGPSRNMTPKACAAAAAKLLPPLISAWQAEAADGSFAAMAALWGTLPPADVAYASACIAHATYLLGAGGRCNEMAALVRLSVEELALPLSPEGWLAVISGAEAGGQAADAAIERLEKKEKSPAVESEIETLRSEAKQCYRWAAEFRSAHSQRSVGSVVSIGSEMFRLPATIVDGMQQRTMAKADVEKLRNILAGLAPTSTGGSPDFPRAFEGREYR